MTNLFCQINKYVACDEFVWSNEYVACDEFVLSNAKIEFGSLFLLVRSPLKALMLAFPHFLYTNTSDCATFNFELRLSLPTPSPSLLFLLFPPPNSFPMSQEKIILSLANKHR